MSYQQYSDQSRTNGGMVSVAPSKISPPRAKTAVEAFIASKGVDAKFVASFLEVESGKRSDNRPDPSLGPFPAGT
jgi:hypothetical protein